MQKNTATQTNKKFWKSGATGVSVEDSTPCLAYSAHQSFRWAGRSPILMLSGI